MKDTAVDGSFKGGLLTSDQDWNRNPEELGKGINGSWDWNSEEWESIGLSIVEALSQMPSSALQVHMMLSEKDFQSNTFAT